MLPEKIINRCDQVCYAVGLSFFEDFSKIENRGLNFTWENCWKEIYPRHAKMHFYLSYYLSDSGRKKYVKKIDKYIDEVCKFVGNRFMESINRIKE